MKTDLNADYWSERYKNKETGWDIGGPSTPLKEYIDQLKNKTLKILIPGCGNAYEAEYLIKKGFSNVFVIDLSPIPLENLIKRVLEFPKENLILGDFFMLEEKFDLIIEQTMFCAIDPSLRLEYAKKSSELLVEGGKLVGVLFNREFQGGPPFGGNVSEYHTYFSGNFSKVSIEECNNSIKPRQGSEVFLICQK